MITKGNKMNIYEDDKGLEFVRHVLGEFETLIEENDSVANYNLSYARHAKRIITKLISEAAQ
jgi:hypothetical protein